jgi:MFS transporter, FSR family, fosmidomycin resistance protein
MSVFSMGGTAGFAIGPLLATLLMQSFGTPGTIALLIPALLITVVILSQQRLLPKHAVAAAHSPAMATAPAAAQPDAWRPFWVLSAALIFRSIFFYGFNTFLPLYWVNVLGLAPSQGGIALALYLGLGLIGVLIGGRLADRYGTRQLTLWATIVVCPVLLLFLAAHQVLPAVLLLIPLGLIVAAPGSSLVVMGQDYLPNHIGVASGVTIGLSVSVGGAAAPLLGRLADQYGLQAALTALAVLPLLSACLIWLLPRPARRLVPVVAEA